MKIKAKQVILVGAFIVLTIVGYFILPKDEIVIDLSSDETSLISEFGNSKNQENVSGNSKSENVIYVHIEGAVNSPGIKEVEYGTRLFELIEIAGGELEEADLSKINLASILKDEQKIYVPYKIVIDEAVVGSSSSVSNSSFVNGVEHIELININTATSEELQKLAGIGPSMAQKILNYREENGYFSSIEDIKNVSGIGETKYNKIKDNITI